MKLRGDFSLRRISGYTGQIFETLARWTALSVTALCWLVVVFELWVRMGSVSPATLDGHAGSMRIVDERGTLLREVVGRMAAALGR